MIPTGLFRHHFQIAYVVRDAHATMDRFRDRFGLARWELMDMQQQQGAASPLRYIALAYAGEVMIELIEPVPDQASIYQDWLAPEADQRLHHLGFFAKSEAEWEGAAATLAADGIAVVASGDFGDVLSFLYADTVAELGHYYELIHLKAQGADFFGRVPHN